MRPLGHIYRAYTMAAQGRFDDAATALAAASRFDTYRALEFGAFFSILPFIPASKEAPRCAATHRGARSRHRIVQRSSSAYIRAHDAIHPHVRTFLLGTLSARLGDYPSAQRYFDQLRHMPSPEWSPSLAEDLALGVRAYVALERGQSAAGLEALEAALMQSFYQNAFRSPYYSGSLQRHLRATLLEDEGRLDEVLRWYSLFEQVSVYDFVFLALSHLRRAEIPRATRRVGRRAPALHALRGIVGQLRFGASPPHRAGRATFGRARCGPLTFALPFPRIRIPSSRPRVYSSRPKR
jgi:hypothetical protein